MEEKKPLYHNRMEDVVLRYLDESMAAAGATTMHQWFVQWRDTYKAPSGLIIPRDQEPFETCGSFR